MHEETNSIIPDAHARKSVDLAVKLHERSLHDRYTRFAKDGDVADHKSLIPGNVESNVATPKVKLHGRHVRFAKRGDNAENAHTVRMREIKRVLRLTTPQLVSELNAYERQFQAAKYRNKAWGTRPAVLPVTTHLMSQYLQGYVMQDNYMAAMCKRLEAFSKYKNSLPGNRLFDNSIRRIMNGWFAALHIDPASKSVSPFRKLGVLIAPFYRRPILAGVDGTFNLGLITDGVLVCNITDAGGQTHECFLDPKDSVLIENGRSVKVGDVLQYSVLMQTEKQGDLVVNTDEPSTNHTTFYRWYKSDKMPRSIRTIELVQAAVDAASTRREKKK